jgi:hypothetical protein|tara:strand:+ start:166 stop:420 length:255 start_codon:yes stop_codon:yes gene_type:complete
MTVLMNAISDESWAGVGLEPQRFPIEQPGTSTGEFDEEISAAYRFVVKLIDRMQRYHERGVDIIDPPVGALHWKLDWGVSPYPW